MQSFTEEETKQIVGEQFHQNSVRFFDQIGQFFHKAILVGDEAIKEGKTKEFLAAIVIPLLLIWIEKIPLLNYYVTRMFGSVHPSIGKTEHQCYKSICLSEEQYQRYEQAMEETKLQDDNENYEGHPCT